MRWSVVLASLFAPLVVTAARAAPACEPSADALTLGALGVAGLSLNLVTCDDYIGGVDIDGAVAIGGTFRPGSGFSVGFRAPLGDPDSHAANAELGETLTIAYAKALALQPDTNGQFYGNIVTVAPTKLPRSVTLVEGGVQLPDGDPLQLAAQCADMHARNAYICAAQPTENGPPPPIPVAAWWGEFHVTAFRNGTNLFEIDAQSLNGSRTIIVDNPSHFDADVVINVETFGGTDHIDLERGEVRLADIGAGRVLFNLCGVAALAISDYGFKGSILGPATVVTFDNGQIDGSLGVKSLSGAAELHIAPFTGTIELGSSGCPPTDLCANANVDDGDECTTDACESTTGAVTHTALVFIDDGDACTEDACDTSNGDITHTALVAIDDGDACTEDACDTSNGDITHTALVAIDDGDACTDDACDTSNGDITHAALVAIDDGDACTDDACDTSNGDVTHTALAGIEDNNACTDDACDTSSGDITHTALVAIDDGDACTDDACDTSNGDVTHTALAGIEDNNACTDDACDTSSGDVTHTALAGIEDNNACTDDACDTSSGDVTHTALVAIDDGNACTDDACDIGSGDVTHTALAGIEDNNACTDDVCDTSNGAITHTALADIEDNNACTDDDCDASSGAVSHTPIPTGDEIDCTTDTCDTDTGVVTHTWNQATDGCACPFLPETMPDDSHLNDYADVLENQLDYPNEPGGLSLNIRNAANMVCGFDLDDRILGGSGNDSLYGGAGDDQLIGEAGADNLYGEAGNDWLRGDQDTDSIDGGSGDDVIIGGPTGADQYSAGSGSDLVCANPGGGGIKVWLNPPLVPGQTIPGDGASDRVALWSTIAQTGSQVTISVMDFNPDEDKLAFFPTNSLTCSTRWVSNSSAGWFVTAGSAFCSTTLSTCGVPSGSGPGCRLFWRGSASSTIAHGTLNLCGAHTSTWTNETLSKIVGNITIANVFYPACATLTAADVTWPSFP